MAAWSNSIQDKISKEQSSTPSFAQIMREQADETNQVKSSRGYTPGPPNKKTPTGWNALSVPQQSSSLSDIMTEQKTKPYSSRSAYTFKPSSSTGKRSIPYYRDQHSGRGTSLKLQDSPVTSSIPNTSVVNVRKQSLRTLGYKDLIDWLKDTNHVYVGRNMTHYVPGAVGSKWGNPFKMGKGTTRESCCESYRQYIKTDTKIHENGKTLLQSLHELKGKTLGCWCHPELCHGHILAQLIDEYCE